MEMSDNFNLLILQISIWKNKHHFIIQIAYILQYFGQQLIILLFAQTCPTRKKRYLLEFFFFFKICIFKFLDISKFHIDQVSYSNFLTLKLPTYLTSGQFLNTKMYKHFYILQYFGQYPLYLRPINHLSPFIIPVKLHTIRRQ